MPAAVYGSKPAWQLQMDVWEDNLDPANNRSFFHWALYIYRGNSDTPYNNGGSGFGVGGPGGYSGTFNAFRFGSTGSGTNYSGTGVGGRVLIASGGDWVGRNPDGSGVVVVNAYHNAASTLGNASIGDTAIGLATLTQAPGVPTSVTLAYTSDSQVTLTWHNNYPSNGAPSSNQIQTAVNGAAFSQVASISPASSLVLSCSPNQKIVAQVRESNGNGSAAWSGSSNPVFTTPAAPSAVAAAKDASQNIVISWTDNVAFAEHQHVVEHGTISGGITTWDPTPLATVAPGTTSFTHTAPDPSMVHVYRVSAKNTDTGALQSAKVTSNSVQLLAAPNKPTFPVLGQYQDKAKNLTIGWTHNPVDTTPQTAFEFSYSTNGGSTWSTSGKVTSTTSSRVIAANTYAANAALTFRVRTWGQATSGGSDSTGASPWSDPQTVTFKTRPALTITAPTNGSTWTQSHLAVALAFSQAESATFVNATIQLAQGGTLLETLDSTTLSSTALATRVADGGSYTITVTATDSNGLVSDPTVSTFTVDYTNPVAASVLLTYHASSGVAQLDITIPAPEVGEVAATAISIERTIDGSTESIIDHYAVTGPTVVSILDTTPTIHGTNYYAVTTISSDGATVSTVEDLALAEEAWAFLSSGPGFADIVSFMGDLQFSSAPARSSALVATAGRARPIALFGENSSLVVSGSATLADGLGSTPQQVEQFILAAGIVCYRDPSGRRMFGALEGSLSTPDDITSSFSYKVSEAS